MARARLRLPSRHRPGQRAEARAGWLFAAPALLLIATFFLLPVVGGLLLSLTDFDLYGIADPATVRFVGADNYGDLARSPVFWRAFLTTLGFVLVGGPATVAAALGAAMLVNARTAFMPSLFRTLLFAPVVATLVAVAVVWRYLYHPRFGLLNELLGLVGVPPLNWLGEPATAMLAIILLSVWKNFGFSMVIFVAGLQAIPEHLYEAARLDGAGPLQQLRHITLPLLKPTLLFVGVTTAIGYFQLFAEPYVLTSGTGGPLDATLSLVLHMYKEGFRWWNIGDAAAVAFVLFAVILGATLLQLALRSRGER
jgi:multiple sugar transport system permease protein